MAIQTATNPTTGERFVLVDNQWAPLQTATNPTTGEQFGLVNNEWVSIGKVAPKAQAAAPAPAAAQAQAAVPAEDDAIGQFQDPETAGIASYLAQQTPAPVPATATPTAAPEEPPPYKNKQEALDDAVNMLEEGVDKAELISAIQKLGIKWDEIVSHGQKRGSQYFKQQPTFSPEESSSGLLWVAGEAKPSEEPGWLEGTANLFKRVNASLSDTATSYLMQSGAIDPRGAAEVLARNAKRRAVAAPSSDIQEGMRAIGSAKTYGEAASALAANPRATFTLLVESVLGTLPAMAPAMVLGPAGAVARGVTAGVSSGTMEYGSVMADVLQDKGVNLLDANAIEKALTDPKIIAEMKDKAAKRGLIVGAIDGLTMGLAGRFLRPARELVAAGKLSGTAAKKATVAAWGKELSMQMAGGGGGEFAAQKATGENKPAGVILEALADAVTAPLEARANLREVAKLEQGAKAKVAALAESDLPKTVQEEEAAEREAITEYLASRGIPKDNAQRIAQDRVLKNRKQRIADLVTEPSDDRVNNRALEYIDAGMDPVEAINRARADIASEIEADTASGAQLTEGEQDGGARQPVRVPSGEGAGVAGQRLAVPDTERVEGAEPTGVVPSERDVTELAGREGVEPAALEEAPTVETQTKIAELTAERDKLLLKSGKRPAAKSPAGKKFDALNAQITELEALAKEPAPATVEESKPGTPIGFTTSQGSEYTVDAEGRTSRTKKSPGKGQGTTYAPHTALYVNPGDHTEILSDMQGGMGKHSVRLGYVADNEFRRVSTVSEIPEGAAPTVGVFNKDTNTVVGLYKAETAPAVGLHPVEKLYNPDGTSNTHIGNAITEIKTQAPTETTGEPSVTETTEAEQAETQGQEAPRAPRATGKSVGRPVTLTEEEKKQKREDRKPINAELRRADTAVTNAVNTFNALAEPLDESKYKNAEALRQAREKRRASKVEAIKKLLTLQQAPNVRGSAVGKRVKEALKHPSITQKEIDDIQAGLAYAAKYGVPTESRMPANPYTAKELTKELEDFIRSPINKGKLTIVDTVEDLLQSEDREASNVGSTLELNGNAPYGVATNGRAYLIADRINKGEGRAAFLHEVGSHLGLDNILTPKQYRDLTNQLFYWAAAEGNSLETQLARKALARVENAATDPKLLRALQRKYIKSEQARAEILAYFIEEATNAGINPTAVAKMQGPLGQWFRALWAAFKAAVRKLGISPEALTAQDVVNMAFGAAQKVNESAKPYEGARGGPKLYSALHESIVDLPTKTATVQGWKDAIKGLVNKGLVKADEVEWSGINDWLDLQEGKVSKEQVVEYLKNNGVQVEEVVLSGASWWDSVGDAAKFERLTLPGGENYRELLLMLPLTKSNAEGRAEKERLYKEADRLEQQALLDGMNGRVDQEETFRRMVQVRELRYRGNAAEKAGGTESLKYLSSHWEQPNVLAHIRVNDRTDADGNKVLFVEEIQSDWGQAGKKEGFAGSKMRYELYKSGTGWDIYWADGRYDRIPGGTESEARAEADAAAATIAKGGRRPPVAPFVTKTEGWLNLALKRIMSMAVEGGYDKVAFVNGQQSADRYDLSKRVDFISYEPTARGYYINVIADGENIKNGDFTKGELEDIVGREIVQKMDAREGKVEAAPGTPDYEYLKDVRNLSGLDLRVGGEGMKAFYDKIVPVAVSKLTKKLGGQLGMVDFTSPEDVLRERYRQAEVGSPEQAEIARQLFDMSSEDGAKAPFAQPGITITDEMRQSVETGQPLFGVRAEKQAPSTTTISKDPADSTFNEFTTGAQALSHIIKTGTAFQQRLGKRLRGFIGGVKFVVLEKGQELPDQLKKPRNAEQWDRSIALYVENYKTGERAIYVRGESFGVDQGVNNTTILHELLHAATSRKLSLAYEMIQKGVNMDSAVVRAAQDLIRTMDSAAVRFNELVASKKLPETISKLASHGGIFDDPHEFVAYGMTDPVMQNFLMQARGYENNIPFFSRFVSSIRKLLGMDKNDTNALTDLIVVTDKLLSAKAAEQTELAGEVASSSVSGEYDEQGRLMRTAAELKKDSLVAQEKTRLSREGTELQGASALFKARNAKQVATILRGVVDRNWINMSRKAVSALVTQPSVTFLAQWSNIKAIRDAEMQMQAMAGMANALTASAYKIRQALARELNPLFRSAKEFRTKFENLVYETTLTRYDPSDLKQTVRDTRLDELYKSVGAKGQKLYKLLRDHYVDLIDLYSDLLDQQVENLQGLTTEAKANLIRTIRATFETGARITPFFPLVRYGDFWFRVDKGAYKGFHMFESPGDREQFARKVAAELREDVDDKRYFDSGDTIRTLRERGGATSEMLKQAFDAIDKQDFGAGGPDAKEALKDAIYQIYLQTMPDQNFRKMFIHRKDRTGFSTDVLRNVASSASRMSMQLARLKYAALLRNSVSAARDAVQGRPNYSPFVDELERRVNLALAGNHSESWGDAFAGVANKVSFFWFLSSAASALIQPVSIYVSALPVLGANHGNMAGAAKELLKAVGSIHQYTLLQDNPDGTTSIVAPSLANNKSLPQNERDALREMFQRGVSQSTYTSAMWGYTNLPTQSASSILGKTTQLGAKAANLAVGALMHNLERLTREATFLAAYRLGYKRFQKTMSSAAAHEAAINQAVMDVNESLANYDLSNRPRWMQKGVGKIVSQFGMFPLHMMLLMTTNLFKMMPFLNKEGKAAAAKKFFGIYLTAGSIAGLAGIPAFAPIIGALAIAMKKMGDYDDEYKDMDPQLWFRDIFLPDILGDVSVGDVPVSDILVSGPLNYLTGLAISQRIGLHDIYNVFGMGSRESKETKTTEEAFVNWVMDHAGPSVGVVRQGFAAYDAYERGDFDKMWEKAAPAIARNLMIANRMREEGVKDPRSGEVIVEPDEARGYAIAQAIGFRPDVLAIMAENNFKLTAAEQKIENQRNLILTRLKVQARKGTAEAEDKMVEILTEERTAFNEKYPSNKLTAKKALEAVRADLKTRAQARVGFKVTKENVARVDAIVSRMEERIERIQKRVKTE